jgi:hypothetical protein
VYHTNETILWHNAPSFTLVASAISLPAYKNPRTAIPKPTAAIGTAVAGARPAEAGVTLPLGVGALPDPVNPNAELAVFCAPANWLFNEVYSALRLLPSGPVAVAAISLKVARAPVAIELTCDQTAVGLAVSNEDASAAADAVRSPTLKED